MLSYMQGFLFREGLLGLLAIGYLAQQNGIRSRWSLNGN